MLSVRLGSIVGISESVSTYVNGNGWASVSAYADPYFFIDPGFLAEHPGFGLAFSPFVGNDPAPSVPEPASWAMMIAGFGVVGAAMRRRNRTAAALA